MDFEEKIFKSHITRNTRFQENNLYSLLTTEPAKPIFKTSSNVETCSFSPRIDKYYVPKKKSRCKVKTVRDIRNVFEQEIYQDLPSEMEKQHSILLRKIKSGQLKRECTRSLALNMLNSDKPIDRTSWHMLMNINPEGHEYPKQYVLWNGKYIQVNGSRGGRRKFICNLDLGTRKHKKNKASSLKMISKRKSLLKNSLLVKFKPGPLQRKQFLDKSHQKFNVGATALVALPKIGLEIHPTYGSTLDSNINKYLNDSRDKNGLITEKWAEFATSVLGTVKNNETTQNTSSCVTFDISYKCNQKKMLMRNVTGKINPTQTISKEYSSVINDDENYINKEVKSVVNEILDAVEISCIQDTLYTGIDESREITDETNIKKKGAGHKEKNKKRYCELDRLDVTVIRLPTDTDTDENQPCNESHCRLGCVCRSLECVYNIRNHCGRIECVFNCKCKLLEHENMELLQSGCGELLPGLLNLNNRLDSTLAKEELKFRQTVIVAGQKSILLKSRKRNGKITKKYAEYQSNKTLDKKIYKTEPMLILVDCKLDRKYIEPWCMVHNLYKCFCKGRFVEKQYCDLEEKLVSKNIVPKDVAPVKTADQLDESENISQISNTSQNTSVENDVTAGIEKYALRKRSFEADMSAVCARRVPFKSRKYKDSYYKYIHNKIKEMEKNDHGLHDRILKIRNNENTEMSWNDPKYDKTIEVHVIDDSDIDDDQICQKLENHLYNEPKSLVDIINKMSDKTYGPNLFKSNKYRNNLVKWFESSYKSYKNKVAQGLKTRLDAPRLGKLGLYAWDFILTRYRERKNLFLVSKKEPYRVFLAVNIKNSFFDNCANIDNIRFADLHKYPATIKNLLTNATDKDENFCILYGFSDWWELIGTVSKVNKTDDASDLDHSYDKFENLSDIWGRTEFDNNINKDSTGKVDEFFLQSSSQQSGVNQERDIGSTSPATQSTKESTVLSPDKIIQIPVAEGELPNNVSSPLSECSKWFVLTIENDFNEIHLKNGGFFVTHQRITKSIEVARKTGKSIRLSIITCAHKNGVPRYGIYALPNAKERSVFVGPYEPTELLGLHIIINTLFSVNNEKRTRGVWVTVPKIDNLKFLENPMSFISESKLESELLRLSDCNLIFNKSLEKDHKNESINTKPTISTAMKPQQPCSDSKDKLLKIVKPIKIRRTDDFYHIDTSGVVKAGISPTKKLIPTQGPSSSLYCNLRNEGAVFTINQNIKSLSQLKDNEDNADTLKTANVCEQKPKKAGGMFILKPEEINKKMLSNKKLLEEQVLPDLEDCEKSQTDDDKNMNVDIENFLSYSKVFQSSQTDVFFISDDENLDYEKESPNKNVWIECTTIPKIGWIKGIRNSNNLTRFEFPGFKPSDFYTEAEVFNKINMVISRKIYVPKELKLEWRIVESEKDLKSNALNRQLLGPRYIMTKEGIRPKSSLVVVKKTPKNYARKRIFICELNSPATTSTKTAAMMKKLEKQSQALEDEGDKLWKETVSNKTEILTSLTDATDTLKSAMTETLKEIKTMADT